MRTALATMLLLLLLTATVTLMLLVLLCVPRHSRLCVCLADCSSRCTRAHTFARAHDCVRARFFQGPPCFSLLFKLAHTLVRAPLHPLPLAAPFLCDVVPGAAGRRCVTGGRRACRCRKQGRWRPGRRAGPPPLLTAHAHAQPAHPPTPFSLCSKMAEGMQELALEEKARVRFLGLHCLGEVASVPSTVSKSITSLFSGDVAGAVLRKYWTWFHWPARARRLLVRQHAHAVPPPEQSLLLQGAAHAAAAYGQDHFLPNAGGLC